MKQSTKQITRYLYAITFFEHLVFWYAIEKILWNRFGVSFDGIIVLGIFAQSAQVFIEIPSSVLADKWNRKYTLLISSIFFAASSLVLFIAQNFLVFAASQLLWAVYHSLRSGTLNAFVYDSLLANGDQRQYASIMGRRITIAFLGLSVGAVLGGVISETLTIFWAFSLSVIPVGIGVLLLTRMDEPPFNKSTKGGSSMSHTLDAFKHIKKSSFLIILFISLFTVQALRFIWYEFDRLAFLEYEIPVVWTGVVSASLFIGTMIGSELAANTRSIRLLQVASLLTFISIVAIYYSQGLWVMLPILIFFTFTTFKEVLLEAAIQHSTPSGIRATTLSLIAFVSRIFFLGIAATLIVAPTIRLGMLLAALPFAIGASAYLLKKNQLRKELV